MDLLFNFSVTLLLYPMGAKNFKTLLLPQITFEPFQSFSEYMALFEDDDKFPQLYIASIHKAMLVSSAKRSTERQGPWASC